MKKSAFLVGTDNSQGEARRTKHSRLHFAYDFSLGRLKALDPHSAPKPAPDVLPR